MDHSGNIEIIPFEKQYAQYFYSLNIEWLKTFFYVETYDEEVLSNPEKYIINKGGHIFFARLESAIVGTVALMPMYDPLNFELTKMAVSPQFRGLKIGQFLMKHSIQFSRENGLDKLILYSNKKLKNAIYIYRKFGFTEVPLESNNPYKRSNIKMQLPLNI